MGSSLVCGIAVRLGATLALLTSFGPAGLSAATLSLTSFSPSTGVPGRSVTISGQNFIPVSSVQFSRGTAYVSGATLGTVPDANWQVACPR